MASLNQCLASLARLSLTAPARPAVARSIPKFLLPSATAPLVRHASGGGGMRKRPTKKKRAYKTFRTYDLSQIEQYSLCDAMRQVHL
jgi:large subunit ribosomal protein L1